jgi:hypothetical protein
LRPLGLSGAAEYIGSGVQDAIKLFTKTGIVHDREDLYKFLSSVASAANFASHLGGKNVGKSLLLKAFVTHANKGEIKTRKGNKIAALYIDGRSESNQPIRAALRDAWGNLADEFPGIFGQANKNEILSSFSKVVDAGSRLDTKALPQAWLPDFLSKQFENGSVSKSVAPLVVLVLEAIKANEKVAVEVFIAKAAENGLFPVLVIDEANKVLGKGEGAKMISTFLDKLVSLTKQEKRMAVVLASSDHSYPFNLEKYGMNLEDVNVKAFANEIPPYSMWDLLHQRYVRNEHTPP